ncbi:stage III sporulation protein AF [Anaerobranca gottschalkii]|uniref:Stage III sporulation protein AF n=1 Tax=Anaerobranca gottschalkii DSM 13577 TaxID=1120990 RepID=A0A1H9Y2A5_9FIRM|nr:stage III sporulation protein AF [Anaerobranca gottschalkii]SES62938.1 stage III sporulation protein AF [Anaerobranca gottschalkii DSM 13577]
MDILNTLVRNLVILVIIMTFLEMFLPEGQLRTTAKIIFGLMIIATLLNPVAVILSSIGRASFDFSGLNFTETVNFIDDEKATEVYNQLTLNQYIENLQNKVIELVQPYTTDYEKKVEVSVVKDFDSKEFGKIEEIRIYLTKKNGGIIQIKPVVIGNKGNDDFVEYHEGTDIKDVVTNYFGISRSKILVFIEREG